MLLLSSSKGERNRIRGKNIITRFDFRKVFRESFRAESFFDDFFTEVILFKLGIDIEFGKRHDFFWFDVNLYFLR